MLAGSLVALFWGLIAVIGAMGGLVFALAMGRAIP